MLNKLAKEIHENAKAHGWWDEKRTFPEIIALCHSELSEALEEYRNGNKNVWYKCFSADEECIKCLKDCETRPHKPEGIAIELADCIIRILDYCADAGIDMDEAIRIKHEYNKTRPYRHGGKKC